MNRKITTHDRSAISLRKSKASTHQSQKRRFFLYLHKETATCSMASEALGIKQKCLCRYKRDLEQSGHLKQLYKTNCKLTGFRAWYLTTNKSLITKQPIT